MWLLSQAKKMRGLLLLSLCYASLSVAAAELSSVPNTKITVPLLQEYPLENDPEEDDGSTLIDYPLEDEEPIIDFLKLRVGNFPFESNSTSLQDSEVSGSEETPQSPGSQENLKPTNSSKLETKDEMLKTKEEEAYPIEVQKKQNYLHANEDEKAVNEIFGNDLDNSTIVVAGTGLHNSYSHPQIYPTHGHGHAHGHVHGGYGHTQTHAHNTHYHQSHAPIKQSVVHRDPYDTFDQYDALRTKDYDRQPIHHHHTHSPHGHSHRGIHHQSNHLNHGGHSHGYGHQNYIMGGYGNHFQPYHYDTHHLPQCAHLNRVYHNLTFCLEDHYYPTETILWAVRQSGHYAQRLLSDVTYQSADNLVDGLTRAEEEKMTYAHYFGGSQQQHHEMDKYKPPYTGYTYNDKYYKDGGYICPSDIYYARPKRAMNTYGKWKVIVNLEHPPKHSHGHGHSSAHNTHYPQIYTQSLRLEQCIYPNSPCSYVDSHYYSRCLQKHNFVRLVAWTYDEGLHVDTFKLPIACSCHIQQPAHYYPHQPHHQSNAYHGQAMGAKHNQLLTGGIHQGKANLLTTILG